MAKKVVVIDTHKDSDNLVVLMNENSDAQVDFHSSSVERSGKELVNLCEGVNPGERYDILVLYASAVRARKLYPIITALDTALPKTKLWIVGNYGPEDDNITNILEVQREYCLKFGADEYISKDADLEKVIPELCKKYGL